MNVDTQAVRSQEATMRKLGFVTTSRFDDKVVRMTKPVDVDNVPQGDDIRVFFPTRSNKMAIVLSLDDMRNILPTSHNRKIAKEHEYVRLKFEVPMGQDPSSVIDQCVELMRRSVDAELLGRIADELDLSNVKEETSVYVPFASRWLDEVLAVNRDQSKSLRDE